MDVLLYTNWTHLTQERSQLFDAERMILTGRDVSGGKDGAYHARNGPLAQAMAIMSQGSAEKDVSVAEGVRF